METKQVKDRLVEACGESQFSDISMPSSEQNHYALNINILSIYCLIESH
jgi:hypothetical protein